MFGIFILIVVNLAIGYAVALYRYQPDRLPIPWEWLPRRFAPRVLVAGGAMGMDSSTALHTGNATTAPPASPIVKPAQALPATEAPPIVEPPPRRNRTWKTSPLKRRRPIRRRRNRRSSLPLRR